MPPATALGKFGSGPAVTALYLSLNLQGDSQAYIEGVVAGWADKKPFGYTVIFLKHGVKPIPVPTGGTISEFFLHLDSNNLVWHSSASTLRLKGVAGAAASSGWSGNIHYGIG